MGGIVSKLNPVDLDIVRKSLYGIRYMFCNDEGRISDAKNTYEEPVLKNTNIKHIKPTFRDVAYITKNSRITNRHNIGSVYLSSEEYDVDESDIQINKLELYGMFVSHCKKSKPISEMIEKGGG